MKKIFIAILLILTNLSFSQTKELTHLNGNLYKFTEVSNEKILQKGFYLKSNDVYLQHGVWKDQYGNKHKYDEGNLVWIKFRTEPSKYRIKSLNSYLRRTRVTSLTEDEMEVKLKD